MFGLLKDRRAFAVGCVIAGLAGVGAATAVPASASGISIQGFPVPSPDNGLLFAPGAIVQGLNGQEWFTTFSGMNYGIGEATTSGTVSELNPSLHSGGQYVSMANGPDGFAWLVDDGANNLSAINPSGGQTVVAPTSHDDRDIALGPDGNLYVSDNGASTIDQYAVTNAPSAAVHPFPVGAGVFPDAIASAGGKLWFSDDRGNLYSMTTGGAVTKASSSPGLVSYGAHTMVGGPGGDLWAISDSPATGYGNAVLKIDPSSGSVLATYSSGIPAGAVLTAITVGADGNLWFPEAGAAGAQGIGQLDPTTGAITSYTLPANLSLPSPVATEGYDIAPGPSNTVWFTAESPAGTAAVGEISGLSIPTPTTPPRTPTPTPPAAGTVTIGGTENVSRTGLASVKLTCKGVTGVTCSGKLTLTRTVKQKVKRHGKTVTVTRTLTVGSKSYSMTAGQSETVRVKISKSTIKALAAAKRRRLAVKATAKPTSGTSVHRSVTLIGPRPTKHKT